MFSFSWTNYKNPDSVCLLQKTILITFTSYRVEFKNLLTNESQCYTANGQSGYADGVQSIAGHDSIAIFAISESVSKPRLLVKKYPSFDTLQTLRSSTATGYLSLSFCGSDHLIGLTGIGSFTIDVWNWRTSQLLGSESTNCLALDQRIR